MNKVVIATSLVVGAFVTAVVIFFAVGLPAPPPQPAGPAPLPWIEGTKTEVFPENAVTANTDDILYAAAGDVWRQSACVEIRVPLFPPTPSTEPISDEMESGEVKNYSEIDEGGFSYFNRCQCKYRVEWTCTRVSRYITATVTMNGQTFVRYLYDRTNWDEGKELHRRLSALVVSCNTDEECDFYCEGATPPVSEWAMQCRGKTPNRFHGPPQDF